jgi:hypothetical protein
MKAFYSLINLVNVLINFVNFFSYENVNKQTSAQGKCGFPRHAPQVALQKGN